MEDIGGIIFYILAAIIGIIGVVNRKKKNTTSAKRVIIPSQTGEEEAFYEIPDTVNQVDSVIEIDDNRDGRIFVEPVEKSSDLVMDASYEGNYSEPMADDFAGEGVSSLKEEEADNKTNAYRQLTKEQSVAAQIADDFDLPKAIVYSEILKRKDY